MAKPKSLPLYFLTLFIVVLLFGMLLSLHYHFLDALAPGASSGHIGGDFFSIPRSFLNLLTGKSIFNTENTAYGPYAMPYYYHPALSLMIGSWLSIFQPWTSYIVFVAVSVLILIATAYLLGKKTENQIYKKLFYCLILFSVPTYLLLWNAQMHVFTVLSVTLIMIALLELYEAPLETGSEKKILKGLLLGLLISLFSKPMVILFLPILLIVKETRRTTLISLAIYGLVSILFLTIPVLNPEAIGWQNTLDLIANPALAFPTKKQSLFQFLDVDYKFDNIIHWINIIYQAKIIDSADFQLFSLPTCLNNLLNSEVKSVYYKIPLIFIFLTSCLVFWVKDRRDRILLCLFSILLSIYSYYLSYNTVWEYHYTTLLPTIPIFLILYEKNLVPASKVLLKAILIISAAFYLPTLSFFYKDSIQSHLFICRSLRVLPVLFIFIILSAIFLKILKQALQKQSTDF